jgi:hypothetical protein
MLMVPVAEQWSNDFQLDRFCQASAAEGFPPYCDDSNLYSPC